MTTAGLTFAFMNLIQRDRQVIWHPYTQHKTMPDPVPIVKGEGVFLIDEDNNRYIDAISSWWVNIHGHAHPYIAKKIYEQAQTLEQVIFAGFTHEPAVTLAERLLPVLPGKFSKIFYSDNGSTAVEVAIKMALQYWWNQQRDKNAAFAGRNKILAFNNSYHGDTFGAMSISDRGVFTLPFQDKLFEVEFIDTPVGDSTSLPGVDWNSVACFIYEPLIQGAGGMRIYNATALDAILKECKKHDVICIADEVMTGFGRTGKLFASAYCETSPDIICLSKGITGGSMALGVTTCTEKIYEVFLSDDKQKTFFHGHSFTANPLACAAALASLDLLLEQSCASQRAFIEKHHQQFLQKLVRQFPALVKNSRWLGTILAFEIESGSDGYLNSIGAYVTRFSLSKGVFLRSLGNTVYVMPPYCIKEEELNAVYDVIMEMLAGMIA